MHNLSKNGVGLATFVVLVAGYFGIELELDGVVDALAALGVVASFVMMVFNQLERKDTKWFFFKK